MKFIVPSTVVAVGCALATASSGTETLVSPYARDTARAVKSMSPEELEGYTQGKGMGLARSAELNGAPGPAHVLELAEQLHLSADQRQQTAELQARMLAKAKEFGGELIVAERALDRMFLSKNITPDSLNAALARIGNLQAQVRGAHLEAHLLELNVLTSQQVDQYARLRGYQVSPEQVPPAARQHGAHTGLTEPK